MGLLDRFRRKKSAEAAPVVQNSVNLQDADAFFSTFGIGGTRAAGMVVNADTAMRFSAVFACMRLIGGAIASAPCKVYRRTDGDVRAIANDHAIAGLLRLRPNRFMTASTFWKWMGKAKVGEGNAYAHIVRAQSGRPVALYPIKPRDVHVYWAWELGLDKRIGVERNRLFYRVTFPDGAQTVYDQDDMLHIPNVGFDGKKGLSTIQAAAQGIGLGLAAEESSAAFFANGMQSNIALTYPNKLSPEAVEGLREYIREQHVGAEKHYKPMILSEGGKVERLAMSAEDAQLIESRQFSVIDICRFFGVPPVMIGETEKTSSWGSGVEQMARWFTMFTLNEHFTAIEQELEVKLFRDDGHFAEFDETELTRGDTKTRADYYKVARGSLQEPAFMTINEVRAAEGLPPVEGGDVLMRPETATQGEANAQQ